MAGRNQSQLPSMQAPKHKACHDEWNEDCKIFVGGLGEEGTRIELEDSFQKFGPIKNIWLAKAPPSFAYIEMAVRPDSFTESVTCHMATCFLAGPARRRGRSQVSPQDGNLRDESHRQDGEREGGGESPGQGQDAEGGDGQEEGQDGGRECQEGRILQD